MTFGCLLAVTDVTRSLWKYGGPTVDAGRRTPHRDALTQDGVAVGGSKGHLAAAARAHPGLERIAGVDLDHVGAHAGDDAADGER